MTHGNPKTSSSDECGSGAGCLHKASMIDHWETAYVTLRLAFERYMAATAAAHCSPHDLVCIRQYAAAKANAERALAATPSSAKEPA